MCFGCLLHAAMWRSHKVSFKRNFPINCVVVFCVAKFTQGETTLNSCLVVWLRFYFSSALISSDSIWSLLLSREQHPMWQYTTGWNARSLYSKCDATSDIHTRKLETLGTWSVNSARRCTYGPPTPPLSGTGYRHTIHASTTMRWDASILQFKSICASNNRTKRPRKKRIITRVQSWSCSRNARTTQYIHIANVCIEFKINLSKEKRFFIEFVLFLHFIYCYYYYFAVTFTYEKWG